MLFFGSSSSRSSCSSEGSSNSSFSSDIFEGFFVSFSDSKDNIKLRYLKKFGVVQSFKGDKYAEKKNNGNAGRMEEKQIR